ncbi:14507_t:CDS:2 [Cetraspora pellucida]|uniref:14507_t:CDS:1 n=1 Tax=Cetraspora pellucida TaxID=1433469 RepID=A0A9N9IUR9_9GLOM|nr:14507_t:CDS:2 [Cetraspora pellucida]
MEQTIPENLQTSLEKIINKVKDSKILEEAISDLKNLSQISDNQDVKEYFQELDQQFKIQELEQQLKEFDEIVLKIKNFNMINLLFDIQTEIFLFIEKVNSLNLESTFSNEIDCLIFEIDKHFKSWPKWNDCCSGIINQFENLNNFVNNNIKDSLFFFEIQENLLTKLYKVREKLWSESEKINEYEKKMNRIHFTDYEKKIREKNEEIDSSFLLIIGLKLAYDLSVEFGYVAKRLKLLDSISIQKILGFLKKLNNVLKRTKDSVEVFKESELCLKDCCFDYVIETLSQMSCLVNNFCTQIIVKKIVKN